VANNKKPKKTKIQLENELYFAHEYRWEFARRGARFIEAQKAFVAIKDKRTVPQQSEIFKKKYGFLPFNPDVNAKRLFYAPYKKSFTSKTELNEFVSNINGLFGAMVRQVKWSRDTLTTNSKDKCKLTDIETGRLINGDIKDITTLRLDVNLTYPKEKLLLWLDRLIAYYQKHGAGGTTRSRFDKYDDYLLILDLRKKGLTYEEIAEKLYPPDCKKNLDSAIQKTKRNYREAKYLAEGGYKGIK